MKKKLEKAIKGVKKGDIVLTLFPKENYEELNMHFLKLLLDDKKMSGAYITVNRPYENIVEIMKQNDLDHKKLFFTDCVTQETGKKGNCNFIKSAQSLTNIGISLEPSYQNEGHAFIFLDSLDGLSLYHKPEMIIKFTRSLINRMRQHNKFGFMISLHEDTDKRIVDELSIICDKVIKLVK